MKKAYWFLIGLSACFYAIPFITSGHVWWLVLLFPVPLLYCVAMEEVPFVAGFVWGLLSLLLHGYGGMCVLAHMAHNGWVFGTLVGMCIVVYCALIIGILFWCGQWLIRTNKWHDPWQRVMVCVGVVLLSLRWIDDYCFFVFGRLEGYPLIHPLLMCMHMPAVHVMMPIIGKHWMTLLFLLWGATAVLAVVYCTLPAAFCFVGMMIFWFAPALFVEQCPILHDMRQFIALPMMTVCTAENEGAIKCLSGAIGKCIVDYPHAEVIIMPESAYTYDIFNKKNQHISPSANNEGKSIHLIIGVVSFQDSCVYNRVYWMHNGIVMNHFDKRHTMLLSERLPWDLSFLKKMYQSDGQKDVQPGKNKRILVDLSNGSYVPYICSELFFNAYPDDDYGNNPIIAIVNDSVFGECEAGYMQRLLALVAQSKAIAWQRDIVYVSYSRALFLGKDGCLMQLQQ